MEQNNTPELPHAREVEPSEYWPIASEYLRHDRRNEAWQINRIVWDGDLLTASARLEGHSPSKTDGNRFHLSIFAAREMEAQLAIIGFHLKLGLRRKTTEVWVLECHEVCSRAITRADDVRFEIRISTRLTSSGKILADCQSRVWDEAGGEIRLAIKRMMPASAVPKG